MYLYIFLAALAIMSASLIGVVTLNAFVGDFIKKRLPYLVSFSAGVFLFTSGFMVLEALHILENIYLVGAIVISGFIGARLMTRLYPEFHHHHDQGCDTHGSRSKIMLGDGIHNIADGLVLVPAFMISPLLGLGTALAILIHEILQELSEFFVLRSMGYSVKKTLLYNFAVSSTILLGVGLGILITDTELLQALLLAFSAGFFFNIVLFDLVPHTHRTIPLWSKELVVHLIIIVLGLGIMLGVNTLFSHAHEDEDEDELNFIEQYDDGHDHSDDWVPPVETQEVAL